MSVKTVTCAACGAEQAILRNDEGKMNCAFCGEPMDLPDYEAGEEMEYSCEQPVKENRLEPIGEGIEAVFVLNEQEVGDAFTVSGKLKERRFILYIESALLALFGIAILVMNILGILGKAGMKPPTLGNWLYVGLCVAMQPVIWLLPKRTKKKIIRNATSGNQLVLTVYENLINIHITGREEAEDWQQPFDGSFGLIHEKNLFVLTLKNGQILVIPERSLTEEQVSIVGDRLSQKPIEAE